MIATRTFVFLHLHKSGGSFVNAILDRYFPDAVTVGYHLPIRELPEQYRQLDLLGVVRNPWGYYVSWWEFQRTLREPTFVWRVYSDDGRLPFAQTVSRMLHCGTDERLIDRLLAAAPDGFSPSGVNLTRKCLEPLRGWQWGWYSFLFNRMYGSRDVHFLRQESLRCDLIEFMRVRGILTPEIERSIREDEPVNATAHASEDSYYDMQLRQAVNDREWPVVSRFGYAQELQVTSLCGTPT